MIDIKWEEPIPFEDVARSPFPVEALPSSVRPYVEAVAESTQTPVDMAATAALAVLSTCIQGRYRVKAKPDWIEPTNLFILIIADPAERKSAVMSLMARPVNMYESEYNQQHAIELKKSKTKKRILDRRQRLIEEKVAKGEASESELDSILDEIARFKELSPMHLFVDDVTPEKLISVLAENNGIASVISAEGGIFDQLAGGMYSNKVNIDVFLKGHAGDSIRVDRVGRNSEDVESPALTLLFAIQPNVLSGLMNNQTFRGRGLTARFLYALPISPVGRRRYRTVPISKEAEKQYYSLIRELLDLESNPTTDRPEIIRLTDEADKLIEMYATALESRLRTEFSDFPDWAGKLCGAVVRISGILARAEREGYHKFKEDCAPLVVDDTIMKNAIKLGDYFSNHAKAAYQLMGADPAIKKCKYVMKAIRNAGLTELSKRDIMRQCRAVKKADELQPVLQRLCDYGYLVAIPGELKNGGGRPASQRYLVNPAVFH